MLVVLVIDCFVAEEEKEGQICFIIHPCDVSEQLLVAILLYPVISTHQTHKICADFFLKKLTHLFLMQVLTLIT